VGVGRSEDAVGKLRVGDGASQLEGADQKREDADRALVGGLGTAAVEAARDRGDHRAGTVGVGVSGGLAAPADLIQEGGRRAAVGEVVAVFGGEVFAEVRLDGFGAGGQRVNDGDLIGELLAHDRCDQVVLRVEVTVEGSVGQAGVGDQGRDPGAVDAVALEPAAGGLDHPTPPGDLSPLATRL